jgi:hypothetical protein
LNNKKKKRKRKEKEEKRKWREGRGNRLTRRVKRRSIKVKGPKRDRRRKNADG